MTDRGGYSLAYFVRGGAALFADAIFLAAFHPIAPSQADEDAEKTEGSERVDLAECGG
ncbi:hypothetical protein AB4Z13_32595 [Rhizobium sp. YAF28]|jgi:hypothetical protein|uniref:hypothetical protein n=1 Tax=Rhizobium sp. YAF28 TaxID=3233081 RepID=UPI003F967857